MFFFCRSLTKEWKGFDSIGKEGRKEGRKDRTGFVFYVKYNGELRNIRSSMNDDTVLTDKIRWIGYL